ncbi:hypothetical protein THIARS_90136 [Thiomonas delicata]|uniref:Transposase n=2 Tax=Thiomonas delicata TaxID=364030 RepID=A0A238D9J7_THIDL|nr:hypothetical protein THIARS_90136 [Thiomonas delicata]
MGIYVDTQRWRCQACGKTFMEPLPAINTKREMTDRLVVWIGQQSLRRTFASIAEDIGLDEKTVRNIFRDYVNELEKTVRFETPTWMGIDEIHIIKPRCVISNIRSNTIVNLLPNRDKKTVINYLGNLDGRHDVQTVAMDMWVPYRDAVQAVMPDARIVIDKFHVIRAFTNWQPQILAYFDHPVTNAYTESLNSLIRVMNRLGRGYSFEALRAKILFTEGVHNKVRPKFRRREVMADDMAGRMATFTTFQHEAPEAEKNYGVDISTLARLIQEGRL